MIIHSRTLYLPSSHYTDNTFNETGTHKSLFYIKYYFYFLEFTLACHLKKKNSNINLNIRIFFVSLKTYLIDIT
jgi:hypothetical protein